MNLVGIMILAGGSFIDINLPVNSATLNVANGACGVVLRSNEAACATDGFEALRKKLTITSPNGVLPGEVRGAGRDGATLTYEYIPNGVFGFRLRLSANGALDSAVSRAFAGCGRRARVIATTLPCP